MNEDRFNITLPLNSIDPKNIEVSELNKEGCQALAFISYKEKRLAFTTKPIKITAYGIPRLDADGSRFYPTDSKREFICIAFDLNQPSCVELKNHLTKADEYFGSEEFRKKLFGIRRFNNYAYSSSVRSKQTYEEEDSDDSDNESIRRRRYPPKPDYCKIKFWMVPTITKPGNCNKTQIKKFGLPVQANTITEIAEHVRFGQTMQFTFTYAKIWANKAPAQGAHKILYGLGLRMKEISIGTREYIRIDFGIPICEKEQLKKAYEKYMNFKKKEIPRLTLIEV